MSTGHIKDTCPCGSVYEFNGSYPSDRHTLWLKAHEDCRKAAVQFQTMQILPPMVMNAGDKKRKGGESWS